MNLPENLESRGLSPEFDRNTVPDALLADHALGERRWARLNVLSGTVTFIDLQNDTTTSIAKGEHGVVRPTLRHRVEITDDTRFQLEFFQETD